MFAQLGYRQVVNHTENKMRPVIICTKHRGVFFGRTKKSTDAILKSGTVALKDARMAIYWGTSKGMMELAATGPTSKSRISAAADIGLNAVTAVFEVTKAAAEKWDAS